MATTSQKQFMNSGGIYAGILEAKYTSGELVRPENYQWAEYPKAIRISKGMKTVHRTTTAIRGKNEVDVEWDEEVEDFEDHIVHNEQEEEAVKTGGKSQAQLEAERQQMINDLRGRGIQVDPTWSYVRLQREMGAMPPREAVEALARKVEVLEREAALKARIAELEALLNASPVDEIESLRAKLHAAGVEVDKRWGLARLRQELENIG